MRGANRGDLTRRVLIGAVLWLVSGQCTDTALRAVNDNFSDKIAVRGSFCTTKPEPSEHPIRILFAVDSSDSMVFNDPNNLHVDAIENVVTRFADYKNVTFGIVRWGEDTVRELADYTSTPVLFTRDPDRLNEAFFRMRQLPIDNPDRYLGGTDYELALDAVEDYIVQDLAENPAYALTAQYYVEFMTDGMPQAGSDDPEDARDTIINMVANITANYGARVDVIYIGEMSTIPPVFFDLLPEMALAGQGVYVQLTTPAGLDQKLQQVLDDDLLLIEYDLASISVADEPRSLVVINRNARVTRITDPTSGNEIAPLGMYVDSDGDGVVDEQEEAFGSDPTDPDSDDDGLGDYFEIRLFPEFSPIARRSPPLSEEELADDDRDGLNDFEENRLGTDSTMADSDGDGLPDGLEHREGSNPMVDDLRADADDDGVSNGFEIRQHTNTELDEGEPRMLYSYKLEPVSDPYQVYNGRRCYEFVVGNITLMETLASINERGEPLPKGFNRLEIWRLEWPAESMGSNYLRSFATISLRGETWAIYRPSTRFRDPPALELTVRGYRLDD